MEKKTSTGTMTTSNWKQSSDQNIASLLKQQSPEDNRIPTILQSAMIKANKRHQSKKPNAAESSQGSILQTKKFGWLRRKKEQNKDDNYKKKSERQSLLKVRNILNNVELFKEEESVSISPQQYLESMLKDRGYTVLYHYTHETAYYNKPTPYQIASYGTHMVKVVKKGNVEALESLLEAGLSPNACNSHGESIVHLACRMGYFELLQVMIDHGCKVQVANNNGRTPLHDICWTTKMPPSMDAVGMLLEMDVHMLFLKDQHGHAPLAYTQKKHWHRWIQFLEFKAREYWPKRSAVLHGEQKQSALALLPCNSNPIKDPSNALEIRLASMVANGTMKPEEAILIRDDDVSDTNNFSSNYEEEDEDESESESSPFDDDEQDDDEQDDETDMLLNNIQNMLRSCTARSA